MKFLMIASMVIGFTLAICTGLLLQPDFFQSGLSQEFASRVASMVPCVDVMARHTEDPLRARFTWSLQWLFAPAYFLAIVFSIKPWSRRFREKVTEIGLAQTSADRRVAIGFNLLVVAFILSDFGVIGDFGLYRGGMFAGEPKLMPIFLRAPFESNTAMAIYAWLIPWTTATTYWFFLYFAFNFKALLSVGVRPNNE